MVVGTGITLCPKSLFYAGYNFGNQRGNLPSEHLSVTDSMTQLPIPIIMSSQSNVVHRTI
jgi:hypothetical protein